MLWRKHGPNERRKIEREKNSFYLDSFTMKKDKLLVFLLSASILLNLVLVVFAFVQKAAADTARAEAVRNEQLAKENEMRSLEMQRASQRALEA